MGGRNWKELCTHGDAAVLEVRARGRAFLGRRDVLAQSVTEAPTTVEPAQREHAGKAGAHGVARVTVGLGEVAQAQERLDALQRSRAAMRGLRPRRTREDGLGDEPSKPVR